VLVADDHELVRGAIVGYLRQRFDVCGEAGNGVEAAEKTRDLRPDVVVLDISMPVLNGLDSARLIRNFCPATKIIVLSMHDSPLFIDLSTSAGADVFVSKHDSVAKLAKTIERLSA